MAKLSIRATGLECDACGAFFLSARGAGLHICQHKPATPQPPDMGELIAKELRQCEENGVADNALIRTSDGGYWRYWADSKSWHSVQAPWVALQARIDAAVARRKAKREQADIEEFFEGSQWGEHLQSYPAQNEAIARAMSTPLPHDPDIHTRLMPWRGKE